MAFQHHEATPVTEAACASRHDVVEKHCVARHKKSLRWQKVAIAMLGVIVAGTTAMLGFSWRAKALAEQVQSKLVLDEELQKQVESTQDQRTDEFRKTIKDETKALQEQINRRFDGVKEDGKQRGAELMHAIEKIDEKIERMRQSVAEVGEAKP